MNNEILIISDYDSGWKHCAKVLEPDGTLNELGIELLCGEANDFYDFILVFESYIDNKNFFDDYYVQEYPKYTELVKQLVNTYKNIILCIDGNIKAVHSALILHEPITDYPLKNFSGGKKDV